MLDRSRRRFEEGTRLVEEAHNDPRRGPAGADRLAGGVSPRTARRRRRAARVAQGERRRYAGDPVRRPPVGRPGPAADPHRRSSDRHHRDGISRARAAGLRAQQCRHAAMLLKHLYRRADDQPQPKIIDVFISSCARSCAMPPAGGVHRDDPAARLDPARHRRRRGPPQLTHFLASPG